ncbi:DedA family protein [Donghicola sp. C2-DW-16]|uniref:DedA family protein n=1 Tax=Donghicola mangrovi TaxID=2729614 RepID=A0ABX2PHI7_9RHOB|nr:YqaA family protein [Donghicola mangrovi]NVO28878.1 DedA family protein [Donghicola mangrovi]
MPYLSLFAAAFVAATLLPAQSEVLLAYYLARPDLSVAGLIVAATIGNVLGSTVNWYLGRYLRHFQDRRWFPVKPREMERAERIYHRFGRWSLLASWAPFIGDPLTLIAGVLREPLPSFLIIVTIAKAGRYLLVAALAFAWL